MSGGVSGQPENPPGYATGQREREKVILALKVILLDRLQGIICSGIQESYLLGVRGSIVRPRPYVYMVGLHLPQGAPAYVGSDNA